MPKPIRIAPEGLKPPSPYHLISRPPKPPEAHGSDYIHERVEIAVPEHLEAEAGDFRNQTEEVMPLEYLMEQDAVEKPAEREAHNGRPTNPGGLEHQTYPPSL